MSDTNTNVDRTKSGRMRRGWLMVKSAWRVLVLDKELTVFAFISMVTSIAIIVIGGIITFAIADHNFIGTPEATSNSGPQVWVVWALMGLAIALVTTYTTAAVIASALVRFRGGDPSIRTGTQAVRQRFGSLTMFTILNFGVGQILAALESRLPFFGKIFAFLADLAWRVANFFSIAVIVDSEERIYPLPAIKKSAGIVRKVWAEGAVSQVSYGFVFLLVVLLEGLLLVPAVIISAQLIDGAAGNLLAGFWAFMLVILLLGTVLVSSTIDGIIKAALYHYATTGESPEHFNRELMKQAFSTKKARKLFGKPAQF